MTAWEREREREGGGGDREREKEREREREREMLRTDLSSWTVPNVFSSRHRDSC